MKAAMLDFGGMPVLWFKFPLSVEHELTDRADPFVYALLFPMMQIGGDFRIEAKLSKSVLDQVTMFCRIWNIWCPGKYKPIRIHAPLIEDDYRPRNRKLITAFSGGLDAAYVAYKQRKGLDGHFRYDFDKSIMLHGADIPLDDRAQYSVAFNDAKKMTDDLDVELVPVETNFRQGYDNWSYSFGSVIVAALNFFSASYFYGAAADDSVDCFQTPWGMNPITDQYFTSDTFRFISDGHEHTRTDRANLIKNWEKGLKYLRVCWCNSDKSKNCGRCEKCVRTKLNFMAVGVQHLPSMPNDLTEEDLTRDGLIKIPHNILYYSEIFRYAKKHNTLSSKWLRLLEKQLSIWDRSFLRSQTN